MTVKRYDFTDYDAFGEVENGTYVLASDYNALKARLANRTAELVAVQERLVEAEATAMAATLLRQGLSLMLDSAEARLAEAVAWAIKASHVGSCSHFRGHTEFPDGKNPVWIAGPCSCGRSTIIDTARAGGAGEALRERN
jgi:hypothetical protein